MKFPKLMNITISLNNEKIALTKLKELVSGKLNKIFKSEEVRQSRL